MTKYDELVERHATMSPGLEKNWLGEHLKVCMPVSRTLESNEVAVKIGNADKDIGINLIPSTSNQNTQSIDTIINHEQRYYNLKNCKVFHNGMVLSENNTLFVDEFRVTAYNWRTNGFTERFAEDVGFYGYDYEKESAIISVDRPIRKISEPCFFFNSNTAQQNWGHFVHDTLVQLLAYDYLCEKLGIVLKPIAVGPFTLPMQTYLFDRLVSGANMIEFVTVDEVLELEDCYLCSKPLYHPENFEVSINAVKYLRDMIQERIPVDELCVDRVYANRKDIPVVIDPSNLFVDGKDYGLVWKPGRKFENMPVVDSIIERHEFQSLTLGECSPIDVLRMLRSTKVIIGIHGGGLMNFILARDCKHVIEICDYPKSWESIYTFATAYGATAHRIKSHPRDDGIHVDAEQLKEVLCSII